jgi:geranylgeranyl diphosphate synthase type II
MTLEQLDCEHALKGAIAKAAGPTCPPILAEALRYAVFPGGARVRPRLCLAVALANDGDDTPLALSAAVAIELLHCASLVHDDLPCFDDATLRRGKPTVHAAFGERIAVLTGDALIVAAFEQMAKGAARSTHPERACLATAAVAAGVGAPNGICAGQAWECEPRVDVSQYHRAKTAALFIASTTAGAAAAGVDHAQWAELGCAIGEAYQVADDIHDATAAHAALGKQTGIDVALDRPSAVRELGLDGAVKRLGECIEKGVAAIPPCAGRELLIQIVQRQSERFFPAKADAPAA